MTIEQVALSVSKEVRVVDFEESIDGEELQTASSQQDATIEVTFRNDGGTGARLTSATVRVKRIDQLTGCAGEGGPIFTTYNFDVTVPTDRRAPLDSGHSLNFEVPANSFDQLALTIGPPGDDEVAYPWLYFLEVEFITSDGASMTTPPLAVVSSVHKVDNVIVNIESWSQSEDDNPDDPDAAEMRQCHVDNLGRLERITDGAEHVSAELQQVLAAHTSALK